MKMKNYLYDKPIRDQYLRGSKIGRRDARRGRKPRGGWLGTSLTGRDCSFFVLGYRSGYRFENSGMGGAS